MAALDETFKKKEAALYAKRAEEDVVTNQKLILEQAIQNYSDSSYNYLGELSVVEVSVDVFEITNGKESWSVAEIIYSKPFAKALWGEYGSMTEAVYHFKYKKTNGGERTLRYTVFSAVSPWQYHLQQMVIAEDPIKYLGENI